MNKVVVINAVGLTSAQLGAATPRISALARHGAASLGPVLPAVTTTVQSTYLTGKTPREHGIVGNGWYFRDECEIKFWRQSDHLVQRPRVWQIASEQNSDFTCANICWWYAMHSAADYAITPRPIYTADGRKIPDIWTEPAEIREELQQRLGQFPLFKFWGPATSIDATRWIAQAAIDVDRKFDPTLSLVYLPHLDYNLQRLGPDDPRCSRDMAELDAEVGRLIDHFSGKNARIIVLSEYEISPVSRPIHINRILRQLNLLKVRVELEREYLDAGASQAFAVADHQIAHVYVNDPAIFPLVARELSKTPGIAHVYEGDARRVIDLDHERSGEIIALAEPDSWFTYYYWLNDERAPDFARTVDIHRKPGYDPAELFIDPQLFAPKARIALALLKKKLGMRYLMNVIPTDATLVKGSHGRPAGSPAHGPILISTHPNLIGAQSIPATGVCDIILRHLFD